MNYCYCLPPLHREVHRLPTITELTKGRTRFQTKEIPRLQTFLDCPFLIQGRNLPPHNLACLDPDSCETEESQEPSPYPCAYGPTFLHIISGSQPTPAPGTRRKKRRQHSTAEHAALSLEVPFHILTFPRATFLQFHTHVFHLPRNPRKRNFNKNEIKTTTSAILYF